MMRNRTRDRITSATDHRSSIRQLDKRDKTRPVRVHIWHCAHGGKKMLAVRFCCPFDRYKCAMTGHPSGRKCGVISVNKCGFCLSVRIESAIEWKCIGPIIFMKCGRMAWANICSTSLPLQVIVNRQIYGRTVGCTWREICTLLVTFFFCTRSRSSHRGLSIWLACGATVVVKSTRPVLNTITDGNQYC